MMARASQIDDEEDYHPPTVPEIIDSVSRCGAREIIQELWGYGYTILPRRGGDPFEFDQKIVPRGMAYQWNVIGEPLSSWCPVPASRHPGLFVPVGTNGDIEVSRMVLVERPKAMVDDANAAMVAKAHKNIDDWVQKYGGQFSGGVKVWTGDPDRPPTEFRTVGNPEIAEKIMVESDVPITPKPSDISWARRLINFFKEQWQ